MMVVNSKFLYFLLSLSHCPILIICLSISLLHRNVGKIVFNSDDFDDWSVAKHYKVTTFKTVDGEGLYILKPLSGKGDTEEVGEDELCDSWSLLPPPHVRNRWDRFQNKRIAEGVWSIKAPDSLTEEINRLVDQMAKNEPTDFHPGTKDVVRDLVHPSIYPLIIDPATIDTNQKNYWGRPYEQSRFQWLPTEVSIDKNGNASFVSPINNLDDKKYPQLKTCLEKIFTALIPGMEKVSPSLGYTH